MENLDSLLKTCIRAYEKNTGKKIKYIGKFPKYRTFDEQLELFKIGREKEIFEIDTVIGLGNFLKKRADAGNLKYGTVTNATPLTSPHNFGLAIDCENAEEICKYFNDFLGREEFITGKDWGDSNHIERIGFKLPKYEFRWSFFGSSVGYYALKLLGGLQ